MIRLLTFLALMMASSLLVAQSNTGSISGKVTDEVEEIIGANVVIYQNGNIVTGEITDLNGNYSIGNLDPGTYTIEYSYLGYGKVTKLGVQLSGGQMKTINVVLSENVEDEVEVWADPIMEQGKTFTGGSYSGEVLVNSANPDPLNVIGRTPGVTRIDDGRGFSSMGGRFDANIVLIDGVQFNGGGLGFSVREVERVEVITGGLPAQYSALGAVSNFITKSPSAKHQGYAEFFSSQFLDPYQTTNGTFGISGPILTKPLKNDLGEIVKTKDGKVVRSSIIGYRLAATINSSLDGLPSALGSFKLKDDKLAEIQENPIVPVDAENNIFRATANSITKDDVEFTSIRPNNRQFDYSLSGKLYFRINEDMEFRLSGQYVNSRNRRSVGSYRLLNAERNPTNLNSNYRLKGLFRHRINSTSDKDEESSFSVFQNVAYSIQFDYSETNTFVQDEIHKNNFFDYGHVGAFTETRVPAFGSDLNGNPVHLGFRTTFQEVDYSNTSNPGYVLYNKHQINLVDKQQFLARNGEVYNFSAGLNGSSVSALHANAHSVFDLYQRRQNNQYGVKASGNFDLVSSGEENSRHSLQFGVEYEQRIGRSYTLNPTRLWRLANQSANFHFSNAIDPDDPTVVQNGVQLYGTGLVRENQTAFDKNLRTQLGFGEKDWINVDAMNPEELSLELFEPTTLISGENRVLNYFGYDYLGQPVGAEVSFEDFFTAKDDRGYFTRPVAPNKPIYTAVYLQDRFKFRDVFMTLGVRVDRYDANTKVLKDPYSLYGAFTAGEIGSSEYNVEVPSTIGDDFMVYVNDPSLRGSADVTGFRSGDQWYSAQGETVNTPSILGDNLIPARTDYSKQGNLKQPSYDFESAFEDFKPTVSVMPRLAFSFPISEDAEFFGHYDVIAQRPPGANFASALNYYNFTEIVGEGGIFGNPNLKMESLTDYQAGYQQKLTRDSKIGISLFYKEMRNLIRSKTFIEAYPIQYESFSNDDFSTSKGLILEYETRRINNLKMSANYTIQFADGTGSNPQSNRGLIKKDINYLFPLDFDQRHAVYMYLDYRFGAGELYNGPKLFGKNLFESTGASLDLNLLSGQPYTKKEEPTIVLNPIGRNVEGQVNGARKPWIFRLDLKFDKSIALVKNKDKKQLQLNLSLRIQNLLNTKNILNVYPYSGSALDDGYLTLSGGQGEVIQSGRNEEDQANYQLLYSLIENNPNNVSVPRRIYLGAALLF